MKIAFKMNLQVFGDKLCVQAEAKLSHNFANLMHQVLTYSFRRKPFMEHAKPRAKI